MFVFVKKKNENIKLSSCKTSVFNIGNIIISSTVNKNSNKFSEFYRIRISMDLEATLNGMATNFAMVTKIA